MSLKKKQEDVSTRTSQFEPQYRPPHQILAQMTEELGEIARCINHAYGIKKPKEGEGSSTLGKELSDLIFAIMCMANSNGIDLEKEREDMMNNRRYKRDNNRFEKK